MSDDTNLVGTCQCCFGQFVVKGTMVFHGYKRPGDGQTYGCCPGVDCVPFELACERTKWLLEGEKARKVAVQASLTSLETNGADELWVKINERDRYGRRIEKVQRITPGWSGEYGRTFEGELRNRIYHVKMEVTEITQNIAFLEEKVAGWEPHPERLVPQAKLDQVAKEVKTAKKNKTEVARAFKALKTAFYHVGAAVNKHARGLQDSYEYGFWNPTTPGIEFPAPFRSK